MKLLLMTFTCSKNKHVFVAPGLPPSYGEFLLRSDGGELRYLDAIEDETFSEVERLIITCLAERKDVDSNSDAVLHAIFGEVACDYDRTGKPFKMHAKPPCPVCGTREMASWDVAQPPARVETEAPPVTHHYWTGLSAESRISMVRAALRDWISTV